MKFKRIINTFIASWIVLSSGFYTTVLADSSLSEPVVESNISSQASEPTTDSLVKTIETNLNNTVESDSLSGNTNVNENTEVNSASTGDASVIATVITIDSQSSEEIDTNIDSYSLNPNPSGGSDIVFTLDPTMMNISSSQPVLIPLDSELETVNNNIHLSSISGDLTADSNAYIGQLNTGDSYANANIINVLGSNISTPDIFLGYITVDGDFTGDILLSNSLLQGITNSTNTSFYPNNYYLDDYKYNLTNNVLADATSGSIDAFQNSSIENISSGDTTNILNTQDLIGLNIYGQTGILVFVNVTGVWDGSILGQEEGVVSALLGVDGFNNPILIPLTISDNIKSIDINNQIKVSTLSGNVTASKNSEVGNIKTGSATTVVNLANIVGSNIRFTNNFGILFITVLGNWYGSFGVDTPYGGQKIISKEEEINPQTSNQNNTTVVKTKLSIHSNVEPEKFVTEQISTAYDYEPAAYLKNMTNEKTEADNNLAWIIPFIGCSIALGLVKANDKKKIKT